MRAEKKLRKGCCLAVIVVCPHVCACNKRPVHIEVFKAQSAIRIPNHERACVSFTAFGRSCDFELFNAVF